MLDFTLLLPQNFEMEECEIRHGHMFRADQSCSQRKPVLSVWFDSCIMVQGRLIQEESADLSSPVHTREAEAYSLYSSSYQNGDLMPWKNVLPLPVPFPNKSALITIISALAIAGVWGERWDGGGTEWLLTGRGVLLGDEDILELDGGDSRAALCVCWKHRTELVKRMNSVVCEWCLNF